jgi:hypothetical protein
MSIWSHGRLWSEVSVAYEMLPYMAKTPDGKPTTVTLLDAAGGAIGPADGAPKEAARIRIDRGGFGVEVHLDRPRKVSLGANSTVLITLAEKGPKPTPAADIGLKYRLVPFGAQ